MGGTPSRPELPLAQVDKPIGLFAQYTQHSQPMVLKVRERRWAISGDDFSIKDAYTGETIFACQGRVFSWTGKKAVTDANGAALYSIKRQHFKLDRVYHLESPDGQVLCEVRSLAFKFGGANIIASFANTAGGGGQIKLKVKGDFFDRRAEVRTEEGLPVGRIRRDFWNAGEMFSNKQTYYLQVAPGVDAALLLAFTICLDECENDN